MSLDWVSTCWFSCCISQDQFVSPGKLLTRYQSLDIHVVFRSINVYQLEKLLTKYQPVESDWSNQKRKSKIESYLYFENRTGIEIVSRCADFSPKENFAANRSNKHWWGFNGRKKSKRFYFWQFSFFLFFLFFSIPAKRVGRSRTGFALNLASQWVHFSK